MVSYGFFDSINHDRRYSALDFSRLFDGLITDGVFGGVGDAFTVTTASNGMLVLVGSGRAWLDHTWTYNDYALPVRLESASSAVTRVDAIVIEVNHEIRSNSIKVVKGSEVNPGTKPTWTNTDDIKKYAIAYVTIPKNTLVITSDMIENVVGDSTDPLVAPFVGVDDSISQQDVDNLTISWTDAFNKSFNKWKEDQEVIWDSFINTIVNHLSRNEIGQLQASLLNKENIPHTLTQVLPAGETTLTFNSDYINNNSLIEIYTKPFGVSILNCTQTGQNVYITCRPLSHDVSIILIIRDMNAF